MNDATEDFDALFDQLSAKRIPKPAVTVAAQLIAPVALEGELTIHQVAEVKTILQQGLAAAKAAVAPLQLDMSAVTECDGAGLQLLLALARAATTIDVRVELQGTPASIAATFNRYGVATHFTTSTGAAQ